MAIDDAEKRKSISGIWIPLIPGVTPNASKDAQWRQQSAWSYSGIAASAPSFEGSGVRFTRIKSLVGNEVLIS